TAINRLLELGGRQVSVKRERGLPGVLQTEHLPPAPLAELFPARYLMQFLPPQSIFRLPQKRRLAGAEELFLLQVIFGRSVFRHIEGQALLRQRAQLGATRSRGKA